MAWIMTSTPISNLDRTGKYRDTDDVYADEFPTEADAQRAARALPEGMTCVEIKHVE